MDRTRHHERRGSDPSEASRHHNHLAQPHEDALMYRRPSWNQFVEQRRKSSSCRCTLVPILIIVTVLSVLATTIFVGLFAWAYGAGMDCGTEPSGDQQANAELEMPLYPDGMEPVSLTMDVLFAVSETMRQLSVAQSEQCGTVPVSKCGLMVEKIVRVGKKTTEVGENFFLDLDLKSDSTCCQKDLPMQCREMTVFIPSADTRVCGDMDENPRCQKFAEVANGLSKCRFVTPTADTN